MREDNECRMYHAFLEQEADRRVRALWELSLQLELGQLQVACELLHRYDGRAAEEMVGTALSEPIGFEPNEGFLRGLLTTYLSRDRLGARAVRDVPQVRGGRERLDSRRDATGTTDVVDVAVTQHRRTEALFHEVKAAADDRRQAPFDKLVSLIADHEADEGETIHRLVRDRLPGGFDVTRDLMADESGIRQMLLGLVDVGVRGPDFEEGC
jgi:hypothetical protein